jgi:hypothetical protein
MQRFRPGIATIGFGLAIVAASPCFAQIGSPNDPNPIGGAMQRNLTKNTGKADVAVPPVLPGTKQESAEPAGAIVAPTDMSPTEALFDAINRGDMASARDAMNRGAELDGRNLLGLTPLELSVDLGRNSISFMLLSMRGDSASDRAEMRAGTHAGLLTGGDRGTPRPASRARVMPVSSRGPAEEETAATPRYESGNGGAPIPAAGFLGFNGR